MGLLMESMWDREEEEGHISDLELEGRIRVE